MSELALQRIHEAKQHRLTRLDLGNCGLTELPDELFELTWLEELILSSEWFEYDYDYKNEDKTWHFSSNDGRRNNIIFLNEKLKLLVELRKLILNSQKKLSDLSVLKDLINLQVLDVSTTKISNINALKKLAKLQQLNLFSTNLENIEVLNDKYLLKLLYISHTQVIDLNPLEKLDKLEHLHIFSTQVDNLTPLKDLSKLKELSAYHTQVNDLYPLRNLVKLEYLSVSNSKVRNINPLKNLVNLQELYIDQNDISDLMPLKKLINLKVFHTQRTKVGSIEIVKNMPNLEVISVTSTLVSDLTPLKNLKKLRKFYYNGSPIINPPREIVKSGIGGLKRYFKQIDEQKGTVELYEAKLIIVGEGGTGKTTLYEKLKDPTHHVKDTPETHGINIHEGLEIRHAAIDNQLFHANLWDFGGQELQYMTHQFFLTPRALYVLMMDARKEAPNLAYWLKIISLLGKDSLDSTEKVRLLLVFNKRQNSTGTPPQYQDTLQYYQDHLDVQYLEVDFSENDKRFENLKDSIERSLVTLPIVKSQLPRKWKDVREDLRQEAKIRTHISTERLAEICSKHSITDEQDQLQLSDYLHKLGSLLHFQNDKTLINWVFLSPEWVVEGVYGFLKNDLIARQNGKFTEDDFFKILSTTKNDKNYIYTRPDSAKILQLMTKNNFDICYESANGNYVAAQLLPENAPPQYKWHTDNGALKFRYQYPVMPKGLMSRLIVRLSEYLEIMDDVEVVWKKGAILSIKTDKNNPKSVCRILMKEDDAESKDGLRQIIFEVMGDPASHRKHALQRVREEVESLHKRWFRSIKADEIVPCCCSECRLSMKPELYKLEKLLKLREKRAETVCYSSGEDISIFHLLEGVYEESEIKNMGARGGFREY